MVDMNDHINSELYCTNCGKLVHVRMSKFDTGNLTIECPLCGHEHYRFVEDGIITEDRWRSSSQYATITAHTWTSSATDSSGGTTASTSDTGGFLAYSWSNTDSSGTWGS